MIDVADRFGPPISSWSLKRRLIVAGVAFLVLMAGITPVTVAGVFRFRAPELVTRIAPYDADARATAAQNLLARTHNPAAASAARIAALAAYRRDPTSVRALSVIGLADALAPRTQPAASRIFHYVEALSRRDRVAQLWLIEEAVAANDIAGALRHYDTAMRTSEDMWARLFPILTAASADPAIALPLNHLLANKPIWGRYFLAYAVGASTNSRSLVLLFHGLLDPRQEEDRLLARRLANQLITSEQFDLAWRFHDGLFGNRGRVHINDLDFRDHGDLPPFDWELADASGELPDIRRRGGGSYAMYLPAAPQGDGLAARRLLRLAPGAYRFRALTGSVPADADRRPGIRIFCTAGGNLAQMQFPEGGGRLDEHFVVAPNCPYQWIGVSVRASFGEAGGDSPWISSISADPA